MLKERREPATAEPRSLAPVLVGCGLLAAMLALAVFTVSFFVSHKLGDPATRPAGAVEHSTPAPVP